jgi:hypothetical protein
MIRPIYRSLAPINFVLCNFDHSSANFVAAGVQLTQWNIHVQDHLGCLLFFEL